MTSAKRGDHLAFVRTELPRSGPQESYRNRGTAKAKRGGSLIRPVSCPFAADEPLDVMFNPDPRTLRAHARRIVVETVLLLADLPRSLLVAHAQPVHGRPDAHPCVRAIRAFAVVLVVPVDDRQGFEVYLDLPAQVEPLGQVTPVP